VNTSTVKHDSELGSWCRAGLVLACALHLGTTQAQTGAPRAEAPTVKVGDRWKLVQNDRRTGLKEAEFERRVTSVTASLIEGTENDGKFVWTTELNTVETSIATLSGDTKQLSFPLEIGKKWDHKYTFANKLNAGKGRVQIEAQVVAYEKVKVQAGEFDAFKIEYKGFWNNDTNRSSGSVKTTNWYAPAARGAVKIEFSDGFNNWTRELVEIQLQP
jgi:hypothetical protein